MRHEEYYYTTLKYNSCHGNLYYMKLIMSVVSKLTNAMKLNILLNTFYSFKSEVKDFRERERDQNQSTFYHSFFGVCGTTSQRAPSNYVTTLVYNLGHAWFTI